MARHIFLVLFLAYYIILTVSSYLSYGKITAAVLSGRISRTQIYYGQMAAMWIPSALLLLFTAFGWFTPDELCLGLFAPPSGTAWLVIVSAIFFALYLIYLLITFFSMRQKSKKGESAQEVPEKMRALYPATRKEKRVWAVTAVSVGITEELLFRGLLIGSVHVLLPALPIAAVLVAAALLFGAGHLYQGIRNTIAPTLLGLLYGVFFIAFGSILPCVLVHILQDLCAVYTLPEESKSPLSSHDDIPPC